MKEIKLSKYGDPSVADGKKSSTLNMGLASDEAWTGGDQEAMLKAWQESIVRIGKLLLPGKDKYGDDYLIGQKDRNE